MRIGLIEDGTAIGDAVVVALQRLGQTERQVGAKRLGAFVVVLTDGVNNAGLFTPKEARTMAAERFPWLAAPQPKDTSGAHYKRTTG